MNIKSIKFCLQFAYAEIFAPDKALSMSHPPSTHHHIARGECIWYSRADWILDEIFRVASHTLYTPEVMRRERERERIRGVCVCVCGIWPILSTVKWSAPSPPRLRGLLSGSAAAGAPRLDAQSVITGGTKGRQKAEGESYVHTHILSLLSYAQWLYNIM